MIKTLSGFPAASNVTVLPHDPPAVKHVTPTVIVCPPRFPGLVTSQARASMYAIALDIPVIPSAVVGLARCNVAPHMTFAPENPDKPPVFVPALPHTVVAPLFFITSWTRSAKLAAVPSGGSGHGSPGAATTMSPMVVVLRRVSGILSTRS